jgi:hypothetical protein
MDPYLEKPGLWKQVHTDLIVDIRRYLAPLVFIDYRRPAVPPLAEEDAAWARQLLAAARQ